jgi:hypothetical protein
MLTRKNWQSACATLAVGVTLITCILACAPLTMWVGGGEFLAKSMAPPIYPGSTAIDHYRSGGPDMMWEVYTYHTTDSMDQVVAYFEKSMPGFQPIHQSGEAPLFVNGRRQRGPLGWLASLAAEGTYPGVGVTISQSPPEAGITVIEVRFAWPAL